MVGVDVRYIGGCSSICWAIMNGFYWCYSRCAMYVMQVSMGLLYYLFVLLCKCGGRFLYVVRWTMLCGSLGSG